MLGSEIHNKKNLRQFIEKTFIFVFPKVLRYAHDGRRARTEASSTEPKSPKKFLRCIYVQYDGHWRFIFPPVTTFTCLASQLPRDASL